MQTILTDVTSIFTSVMSWLSTLVDTVTGQPLMMLFILIPVIFLGVSMFRRLLRL